MDAGYQNLIVQSIFIYLSNLFFVVHISTNKKNMSQSYFLFCFDVAVQYNPRCNGWRARRECGRSWDSINDWVKPKTIKLVFVASPLSTQH